MAGKKSLKVPKGLEETYTKLTAMTDRFCREHLNEEYAELARYAIAALCRKRPSPLLSGRPETWACAVLYALGQTNFLSDRSSEPFMTMADLCTRFGVGASTAGPKAKIVRDLLDMNRLEHHWMLPSRLADSPLAWMIVVNGLPVDARQLPREVQEIAFEKGLIPYIPED